MRRIALLLFVVLVPLAMGREYHMKLLAVSETADQEGMVADLYLEVTPGRGRVFIDTFPLTKIDTQISTRFAKGIACNYLETDCSGLDFFYTIRSGSVMVGGPSAGAALAILTVAALLGYEFDENIAVTGTINSGGLIGSVGGLVPKIEAAAQNNLSLVMIPQNSRDFAANDSNITDLAEYGRGLGINVTEVSTIGDALRILVGKSPVPEYTEIEIDTGYTMLMERISRSLCNRTEQLFARAGEENSSLYLSAMNLSQKAQEAAGAGYYYAAASHCFGANIMLSREILVEENPGQGGLVQRVNAKRAAFERYAQDFEKIGRETITDLQTYQIVKERIAEAQESLDDAVQSLGDNETDAAFYSFAYAVERFNSAVSWSTFMGTPGRKIALDDEAVKNSCVQKLAEAQERFQYVQLYLPNRLGNTRAGLDRAYGFHDQGSYEMCLFEASKAKAEADTVLSSIGVMESEIQNHVRGKLGLAKMQVAKQAAAGNFPILGYSYYEYAARLADYDPYSALVYAEYALELSNLEMYFGTPKQRLLWPADWRKLALFVLGAVFGSLFTAGMLKMRSDSHVRIRIRR